MLSFLAGLLHGILSFLGQFLPSDPLLQFMTVTEDMQTALGWLNFFLPLAEFGAVLVVYLGVLVAVVAVKFALGKATGVVGKLVGGGGK